MAGLDYTTNDICRVIWARVFASRSSHGVALVLLADFSGNTDAVISVAIGGRAWVTGDSQNGNGIQNSEKGKGLHAKNWLRVVLDNGSEKLKRMKTKSPSFYMMSSWISPFMHRFDSALISHTSNDLSPAVRLGAGIRFSYLCLFKCTHTVWPILLLRTTP